MTDGQKNAIKQAFKGWTRPCNTDSGNCIYACSQRDCKLEQEKISGALAQYEKYLVSFRAFAKKGNEELGKELGGRGD